MKKKMRRWFSERRNPSAQQMLIEFRRSARNDKNHPAYSVARDGSSLDDYVGWKYIVHAAEKLESLRRGDKVVFEGHCPSGPTYCGYNTWEGNMESAQEILRKAWHSSFGAWSAWLVLQDDCRNEMFVADMLTGDYGT